MLNERISPSMCQSIVDQWLERLTVPQFTANQSHCPTVPFIRLYTRSIITNQSQYDYYIWSNMPFKALLSSRSWGLALHPGCQLRHPCLHPRRPRYDRAGTDEDTENHTLLRDCLDGAEAADCQLGAYSFYSTWSRKALVD